MMFANNNMLYEKSCVLYKQGVHNERHEAANQIVWSLRCLTII